MVRAVVVGGLGFLGSAVVEELLSRGDEVRVADPRAVTGTAEPTDQGRSLRSVPADILDPGSLRRAFAGADEVYHFGGRLGTSELEDDVPGAIAANITGAVNVFEAAIATGVPAVFYPSKPNVWLNTYTITKFASEQFARLYAATHPLRIASLRYFNAYGPGQAMAPIRKIIPTFAGQAWRGEPLTIYGDGEQTVDMISSLDIGRISVDFLRSSHGPEPLDCGRGIELTVNEVAAAVNALTGNRAGCQHLPMRRGEPPGTRLVADTGPLRALLPELRFLDWEQSLAETIAWYAARAWPAQSCAATVTA